MALAEITCKVLVVGAGPGGYVCAIRAGQLGLETVIVEQAKPGGTCLTIGCIPSKALIHAAEAFAAAREAAEGGSPFGLSSAAPSIDLAKTVAWKDGIVRRLTGGVAGLLKKAKVRVIAGRAHFRDGKTVEIETEAGLQVVHAETMVIATGSVPVELPFLPFGGTVISSTEALDLTEIPRRLAVVGGGYIGLELGNAFARLGSRVTVVEAAPRILPLWDAELTKPVAASLAAAGIELVVGARAKGLSRSGALLVQGEGGPDRDIEADTVLVAVGRRPSVDGVGLEGLDLDRDGAAIRIDQRCRTSMRGVYAIGDVTGEPMLAHRAMAQGEMVAELLAGSKRVWDKAAIPAICFTDPEIVSVGLSPEAAKDAGLQTTVGQFPLRANGRAMTLAAEDGFVRVVARADNHLVLGIQAVGRGVSELSTAFTLAIEMGARTEDVAATVHAHPTLGEAFQEAALGAQGHFLHL